MKAGIYKRRDNGKHIYVRKDRSIAAFQLSDVHPADGIKVSTADRERLVYFTADPKAADVIADRVADVPNGCTDAVTALSDYVGQRVPMSELKQQWTPLEGTIEDHIRAPEFQAQMRDLEIASARLHDEPVQLTGEEVEKLQRVMPASAPPFTIRPGDTGYDEAAKLVYGPWPAQTLRECGWRPVHRQSARKHRRKGDEVKWVPETGGYWWRKRA